MANQQSSPGVSLKDIYQVKADIINTTGHTGDTDETSLASCTIPGGKLGNNGALRIKATGASYGNNDTKTFRLKLGGVVIATLVVAAHAAYEYWTLFAACHNVSAENSQKCSAFWLQEATIELNKANIVTSVDTSADKTLEITGQLAHASDECYVWDFTVEINPM